MAKRQIEFTFDEKTGETTAETKGLHGKDCEEALKKFKLGEVTDEKKTGDYYKPAGRSELINQKNKLK